MKHSPKEIQEILDAYEKRGGMTSKAFCQAHEVGCSTLFTWLQRAKGGPESKPTGEAPSTSQHVVAQTADMQHWVALGTPKSVAQQEQAATISAPAATTNADAPTKPLLAPATKTPLPSAAPSPTPRTGIITIHIGGINVQIEEGIAREELVSVLEAVKAVW